MIQKYKRAYSLRDFQKDIEYELGKQFYEDFSKTAYFSKLNNFISESRSVFKEEKRKDAGKGRLTFPFYLLSYLFCIIFAGLKFLITGNIVLPKFIAKFMQKWDDFGGFRMM